ncbi:MAG: hypothetical protein WBV79_14695 [Rhodomicrobium sp.]
MARPRRRSPWKTLWRFKIASVHTGGLLSCRCSPASATPKDGKAFALEILKAAQPGTFAEVTYSWPRLLSNDPVRKTSYVTRIDDQVCGVGYYN